MVARSRAPRHLQRRHTLHTHAHPNPPFLLSLQTPLPSVPTTMRGAAALLLAVLVLPGVALGLNPAAQQIAGNVRIQALSDVLVRIEFKGPMGFE